MTVAGIFEAERSTNTSGEAPPTAEQQDPGSKQRAFDVDPADPRRRVPHKKINSSFLTHQRWKEAQKQANRPDVAKTAERNDMAAAPADSASTVRRRKAQGAEQNGSTGKGDGSPTSQPPRSLAFVIGKWLLVTVLVAVGAGQFIAGDVLWGYRGRYTKIQTYVPPTRVFTVDELAQYNGQDQNKPVLLSILGNVYDVSEGRWIYGPRGSYRFFSGRDASRAYVTGCFDTHLTHDLRGLSEQEIQSIETWKKFYDDHGGYFWVGKLDLPPIDPKSPIPAPCREAEESNVERTEDAQKPVS